MYIILLGVLKCKQFCCCCSVKVYEFSCSAEVYAVFLLCQSLCTMQSCCSAKVYAVLFQCQSACSLVAVPKCMHYAVLLQCQSVCMYFESCCSAKVYALYSLVAVPKCIRFVAVPENLQFLQRGVSRSQRLLRPDHRRHLPLRGQQIPLQEVTTFLCRSLT